MLKKILLGAIGCLFIIGCETKNSSCKTTLPPPSFPKTDSLANSLDWPQDLKINVFAGPDVTPSPACLAVAPTGEVFVGIDMIGSLGKEINKGYLRRLVDCNHDGIMDSYTDFAQINNPRGILPVGNQVFVLHTRFSETTKKAENMDLVVFEDKNNDGVADGPPQVLISNISNSKYIQERGTDHATNGIQMGIDGWIYIAVGDFGFHKATDREGTELTMLGGGVLRVRPDGTEMEIYTHGLRNIYDIAIDPYMNIFTRGNTNDGGGWNVRFAHQIQSGEYGYPVLFKHFTEEIIPALVDVGGGSGTGALFLNDGRWPELYNNTPLMADWGRSQLYMHHVTTDGASFTQDEEQFLNIPQITDTDVDIDASGAMYLSAWDGAGYSGSPDKGYILRATPKSLAYEAFEDTQNMFWTKSVSDMLKSENAKSRVSAQYELLRRQKGSGNALKIAKDKALSLEVRVAALFTYAQLEGKNGIDELITLSQDSRLQEFALRALADRKTNIDAVPINLFIEALKSDSDRVKAAAIIGLGRLGKEEAILPLLQVKTNTMPNIGIGKEGRHARPNSQVILPHLAVKSLVALNAVNECIEAVTSENGQLALWALRYMHNINAVKGLIEIYNNSQDTNLQTAVLQTLARIYHKEEAYDASWWWGTRPDTHGPYYKTISWEGTPIIKEFLVTQRKNTPEEQDFYAELNTKYRLGIREFGTIESKIPEEPKEIPNLEELKSKKGQVGKASIEDILLALQQIEGNPEKGEVIYQRQACATCHSLKSSEVMKGPFMGQIGSIMNKEQIAESILKPDASISQGFSTVKIATNDRKSYLGFVTHESATDLVIRSISGVATPLKKSEIKDRNEMEGSMMPEGLVNALSFEELASLVAFLEQQK